MVQKGKKIWLDGELVDWDDANVHILTHTLHYGMGAFEGIRCYRREDGRRTIFRLKKHLERLFNSAMILTLDVPFSYEEVFEACVETVRVNGDDAPYIRPLVFVGDGAMGLYAIDNQIRVAIITWPWGSYLGDDGLKNGIRAKVPSYTRAGVNSNMVRGKLVGQYINSILAKREVVKAGYQEAILLDSNGLVTEGSGENIFIVIDGVVYTTPVAGSILLGVTRDTVLHLLDDMGVEVRQQSFTRDTLYIADEMFVTGTAAEITPVREVDDHDIGTGKPGEITREVQRRYFDLVRGGTTKYDHWLTVVD